MKFRYKISALLLLPLCLGAGAFERDFVIVSTPMALFMQTGENNADLDIDIGGTAGTEYTVVARLYNSSNSLVFAQTFTGTTTKAPIRETINYPLRNRLTSKGLRFDYVINFLKYSKTLSGYLYPYSPISINATQYRNEIFSTDNRFIKLYRGDIITSESFSFPNYNEFLSKTDNNILDFSTVRFSFPNTHEFRYTKAEFHIKDYKNVYRFFPKVDDEVIFDMEIIKIGSEYSFKISQDMYVNKETLDMFPEKALNSLRTSNLYVPIRKQNQLQEDDCYILIKEAGYSAVDIVLPLTFYFDKLLIGLCYESDYCIEGGIKE